jgi:cytochrome c556
MEPSEERSRGLQELSSVAAALARTARRIPDVLAEVELSEEHRQRFVELADRLALEATQLKQQSEKADLPNLRQTASRIAVTCDDCHTAFRVLPLAE